MARNSTRGRRQSVKIGVIAEDRSDIAIFEAMTAKLIKNNLFAVIPRSAGGSGNVRRKCGRLAKNLTDLDCDIIVVIHDLDDNEQDNIRREIEGQFNTVPQGRRLILIPIREIEAWLLADPEAIQSTFNTRETPRISPDTQTIQDPKEFLRRAVTNHSQTTYINTIHNGRLAHAVSIDLVKERCPSFRPYPEFLETVFTNRNDWVT